VNLVAGFHASTARVPARPALFVDGETLSYAQLAALAARIAATITNEEPESHPFVGILAHRSLSAYAGVLGVLTAGRTYVPLHPGFPRERSAAMRRLSGARVLIVGREGLEMLRQLLPDISTPLAIILPEMEEAPDWAAQFAEHRFLGLNAMAETTALPAAPSGDGHAYLLFTSGSTGEPKGVAVSHRNARAYVDYICERYDINENDRFSQTFDLTFDLSVHDMFVCWERGACLCSVPQNAVVAPAKFIRDQQLTMWFSVPSTAGRMLSLRMLQPDVFPSLRASLFCGEPLPREYTEAWSRAAKNSIVENLYGPTEATIAITYYRWEESSPAECVNGIVPIGRPFTGQHVCVVDADRKALPAGEEGELCLAGSQVTGGYLNNHEKTRSQFVHLPGDDKTVWYRTGDLVRQDDDGGLVYIGRIDHQVKIRGFRVELQEIEHVLREATGGASVVAVPWPVRHGSADGVVAFVCGQQNGATGELLTRCKDALPEYMVPRSIRFVDEMPLNSNGKIDRKQLALQLEKD